MAAFYSKWARDIRDSQTECGLFSDVSPFDGPWHFLQGAPAWSDAGVIIPWQLYRNYGDTTVLSVQYEAMKRHVNYIDESNPDHIWRLNRGGFNDWLNGDNIAGTDFPKGNASINSHLFSTAYFAYTTTILAKTAELLGKKQDAKHYANLTAEVRKAFIAEYVKPDGRIEGDTQSTYATALQLNLVPETLRVKAAAHMVEAIKRYDYRISTGMMTTIWLMNQLCDYGYDDIAYTLLLSRRFPSWFYSIDQGATTIWERWDGYVEGRGFQDPTMNSFNHVAFGAVGEWMYSHILGIRLDENNPGYRRFIIRPCPGNKLDWARGSYHSINGLIEVAWKKNVAEGKFILEINVPANTEATVILPDNKTRNAASGKHTFTCALN
jgi:alpha-L-rhamnosidase